MDNRDLVTLRRFSDSGEANIFKALLESADIKVVLAGEYVNEVYPVGYGWAPIDLKVASEDVARAKEILTAGFDKEEFKTESARKADTDNM